MDLLSYGLDALQEDATLVLCCGRDRAGAGPRLCRTHLDERGHGDILTPAGVGIALASCRAIGTGVS